MSDLALRTEVSGAIFNSKWVSEESVPDPKTLPRLPGWNILVRPLPVLQKTKGNIIIPDSVRDSMAYLNTIGKVLVIGEQAFKHHDFGPEPWCKVGDYVIYGKLAGQKLTYQGVRLILLPDRAIEMVANKPGDFT